MATSDVTLNSPNPSRTYDASRHCVCFFDPRNCEEVRRVCSMPLPERLRGLCAVASSREVILSTGG
jgi:hypothetical protein